MGVRQALASARARPFWIFGSLSLLVMLPLLLPGYILTLDMVFTPRLRMPDAVTSGFVFRAGLAFLNILIPSQVIQKVLLLGILFLSGWGVFLLARSLEENHKPTTDHIGMYMAGALYMVNPFTYSRFMAGQYLVLLGYALLPFFARAWLRFLHQPSPKKTGIVSAWVVAISVVSIHTLGAVIVLATVGLALEAWRSRRHPKQLSTSLQMTGCAIILVLLASSYWLVPLLTGQSKTAQAIQHFDTADRQAFATEGGNVVGQLANIVRLQGFWTEGQGLYALPQDHVPAWGLLAIALWALVITGGVSLWRQRQRSVLAWLAVSAGLGAFLATSVVNNWLATWIPLFSGFREPHKFVGLVALAYALLAGRGVDYLVQRYRLRLADLSPYVIGTGAAVLIAALTPTMFWGLGGQLQPRQYPADWAVINGMLNHDTDNFQTVFLPWHLYTQFNFSQRIIVHPAPDFFDKPVLVNNNPEFAGIKPTVADANTQSVSDILASTHNRDDLGARLAHLHIKYVILSKDADADQYQYLDQQTDLQLVKETNTLKLYQNKVIIGEL